MAMPKFVRTRIGVTDSDKAEESEAGHADAFADWFHGNWLSTVAQRAREVGILRSALAKYEIPYLVGDVKSVEFGSDVQGVELVETSFTFQQSKLSRSGAASSGSTSSSSSTGGSSNLLGSKSGRFGALRASAFAVGLLDGDADLALVEELRTVRVFVDVSFLPGHKISRVLQVVEQEFVEGAAFVVEDLDGIAVSIIDGARVDDGAEGVNGLGVTGPFVVDLLTNGGELDGLAGWSTIEDLEIIQQTENKLTSYLQMGMGTTWVWKAVVRSETSIWALTVLSASM